MSGPTSSIPGHASESLTKGEPEPSFLLEARENELLVTLVNDITSVGNKKEILETIQPKLKQLFNSDDLFICRLDYKTGTITPFLRLAGHERQGSSEYNKVLLGNFSIQHRFIRTILESKSPVIYDIAEVAKWEDSPDYIATLLAAGIKASLSTPLYFGGELLGVLTIWSDKNDSFTERHKILIQKVADQVSIIVSNISDNEKIRQKQKQNDVLLAVSHAIASIRDKHDLARAMQQTLKSVLRFSDIAITRFNLVKNTFRVFIESCEKTSQHPDFEAIAYEEYPIADGIHDAIMHSADTVMLSVSQLKKDGFAHIAFLEAAGIKELAGIRLKHNDNVIGTMVLLSAEENSFSYEDRQMIREVSHHFATAMVNIIYHEEIREREHEKSILLSFSNEIATVRNKEDLFRVVKNKLKELFNPQGFAIGLINDDRKTHSAYLFDLEEHITHDVDFEKVITAKHAINDGIFNEIIAADDPVLIEIDKINDIPLPVYAHFWKKLKIRQVIGSVLRVGSENLGCLLFHMDAAGEIVDNKKNLLKGICAQLSIALSNILANDKIASQLQEISLYKEQLEEEKQYLQQEVSSTYAHGDIIGNGPAMQKIYQLLSQVAFADSTVLVTGETGTGKELVARALHSSSPRRDKLMVKVNCATLPPNLIESELFGHEKGSFTGAVERRIGKFELAHQGTLFLDEIGEMPPELQVKLLRAIQEKEFERIGGKIPIRADVRIIAATNRNLQREVSEGKFRTDLFYRLNVFPIHLPALRDRMEDIPELVAHFIDKYAKLTGRKVKNISGKAMKELVAYSWPGNIRELEHMVERSVLMTEGSTIRNVHLPVSGRKELASRIAEEQLKTHEQNERDHIIAVLNKCNGKIYGPGGAAAILELRASTLNSKIKKLGIKKNRSYT